MIKFRLIYDKDKEVEWLNGLSKQGWAMTGFCAGFYTFEACEPGKYEYQVDFTDNFFSISEDYREFMQEAGVEIVQRWGYWVVLRKVASDEEFQLYTDVDSSIEHYKKIRKMFKVVTIIELILTMVEYVGYYKTGSLVSLVCSILLSIIVIVLIRAVVNTNNTINNLMERKTGIASEYRGRRVSPFLASGMFLNLVALVSKEHIPHAFVMGIQIGAIIILLVGLYQTASAIKKTEAEE